MPLDPAERWHREVPGTRWFRSDLHVHTPDDHPGNKVKLPAGLPGLSPNRPEFLRAYARRFLDSAVARGIEVVGLTPHDIGPSKADSAVWTIVETWKHESDDHGRRYRDLVYAVFPGFEPALNDGKEGVHLIVLVDAEIGFDAYAKAFGLLMGATTTPWKDGKLALSSRNAPDFMRDLHDVHERDTEASPPRSWDYIVLAPHAFSGQGVFNQFKSRRLDEFPCDALSGLELPDSQLPEDVLAARPWLREGMLLFRHALYHASDAYSLPAVSEAPSLQELGWRFTLFKLGAPSIASLRQAFLASEARVRIAYSKLESGGLTVRADLPSACPTERPWVRSVRVGSGASFHAGNEFRFSPDLTCIIGGSMTGKSTLLDGLRLQFPGESSASSALRKEIVDRASLFSGAGTAAIDLDSPALDTARPVTRRFRPRFFSQGEIRELAGDGDGIEAILFGLAPHGADELFEQRDRAKSLDASLLASVDRQVDLEAKLSDAVQEFDRTCAARERLERFRALGIESLKPAQEESSRFRDFAATARRLLDSASTLALDVEGLVVPSPSCPATESACRGSEGRVTAGKMIDAAKASAKTLADDLRSLEARARELAAIAEAEHAGILRRIQDALVSGGGSATELHEFGTLARAAMHYDSYRAAKDTIESDLKAEQERFAGLLGERDALVVAHRERCRISASAVAERFRGRIEVEVEEEGRFGTLEEFVRELRETGITRWWNAGERGRAERKPVRASDVRAVAEAVAAGRMDRAHDLSSGLGMTKAVATSFVALLGNSRKRLQAIALRSPDRYAIVWNEPRSDGEGEGTRRVPLEALSGGKKHAILLSLLLETEDSTPIFIDQPEDELDNRYLNETIIPALHRLKGKRQVVFATHNANLVVNGDADQVIALEADAGHGRVGCSGAIDDPEVRKAIVATLDGGEEAFRLRRRKYGF